MIPLSSVLRTWARDVILCQLPARRATRAESPDGKLNPTHSIQAIQSMQRSDQTKRRIKEWAVGKSRETANSNGRMHGQESENHWGIPSLAALTSRALADLRFRLLKLEVPSTSLRNSRTLGELQPNVKLSLEYFSGLPAFASSLPSATLQRGLGEDGMLSRKPLCCHRLRLAEKSNSRCRP